MAKINYYPETGEVLPNGNLYVKTSGRDEDGEIWDGAVEIGPDDPNYAAWLELAKNKEQYLKASREQRNEARRKRREANRIARESADHHDETP